MTPTPCLCRAGAGDARRCVVAGNRHGAARSELRDPSDRDRRTGAANPQPATWLDRGCADGLWRRTPQERRSVTGGPGRSSNQQSSVVNDRSARRRVRRRCAPLPGCNPRRRDLRRGSMGVTGCGARLGVIQQHGFGDRSCGGHGAGAGAGCGPVECRLCHRRLAAVARSSRKPQGSAAARPPRAQAPGRTGTRPAPAASAGNRSRCRISATARIRPPPHRTRSATADDR